MTDFTKRSDGLFVPAEINRRSFLAGTAALGLVSGLGGTMTATGARAQEPVRGGHLKLGLKGVPPPTCSTRPPTAPRFSS